MNAGSRLLSLALMFCAAVLPETTKAGGTVRVELSNDVILTSDNQFTNGISAVVSSEPVSSLGETGGTPAFGKALVAWAIPDIAGLNYRESWVLGQNMETPANIEQPVLIENDVPYVGFLGWGNSFYGFDDEYFFGAQWLFGWVGEPALARQAQVTVHTAIGGDNPEGWDNQLAFEPILNGYISAKRRLYQNSWFDVALSGDAAVGNYYTFAQPGLEFRIGDRPQGFTFIPGPVGRGMDYDATIAPVTGNRFYASITLRATYFAWALPREGNLLVSNDWTDSNTIKINRTVGQTILGLHWLGPRFGAHLSLWLSTETVDDDNLPPSQDPRNSFGSFMAEYRF
ncbi:lipid A deacylase LpxR family protein [Marinobacter sp. 2_MG-2023]|uniref:lipid A deacylase LpxR family protein n=1 Tax=Marinobacter sp. 2_MG-2023 TaxID=3062679 RepID=UPI0026E43AB4|nr:lipid A deacylase LpxR family protein [Marinobacter sp. 2_MG-2023]MDO6441911.1 lipid A deacylase LpxR family protein [Marinobacter sp. 2_MG-2023]